MLSRLARQPRRSIASWPHRAAKVSPGIIRPGMVKPYLAHEERTSKERRQNDIHDVYVDQIEPVNASVKLFKLRTYQDIPVQFRAGQWLDVFVPGLRKAGGFTITSTPYQALDEPGNRPFVELAVQNSPRNPPAAWLWDDPSRVLKQHLKVRVGGSFTWPAEDVDSRTINHVLFIAAGVGVNPLMSMLSHFFHPQSPRQDWSHITVSLLYTSKQNNAPTAAEVLFLSRILDLASKNQPQLRCQIHLTGASASSQIDSPHARFEHRRPTREDYERLLGEPSQRKLALCYVCGPQAMTDETVGLLQGLDGMRSDRVLCEKWW